MKVDAYASAPNYLDHIAPLWLALTPDERGTFFVPHQLSQRARQRGVEATVGAPPQRAECPQISAGIQDVWASPERPHVFLEHGAGQAYEGPGGIDHEAYSGGRAREAIGLFLCPNEPSAARNRVRYPYARSEVIGCPKLDEVPPYRSSGDSPVVAITHHWNGSLVPETRHAFPHFAPAYPELARAVKVIGHAHPRIYGYLARRYESLGIECVPEFDDVLARASLLIGDNTSALYEFPAATGRPVVVLNSPLYRRDVDFWPRFWSCADVGLNCDRPEDLVPTVLRALDDPVEVRTRRRQVCAEVYPLNDGKASWRGAQAIREVFA